METTATNIDLIRLGNDVSVSIDENGYVVFKVKDLTVNSKETVTTVVEKAHGTFGTAEYVPTSTNSKVVGNVNDGNPHSIDLVREANGMLKVYVDGKLSNSTYDENHINEAIKGGAIVVGDSKFTGKLSQITVRNSSVGYDEVTAFKTEIDDIVTPSHENWTATACSQETASTGDANAMGAIDGNLNSWWHTNYHGQDNCSDPHWIAVDFNGEETFDKFLYTGRGSSSNGSIKDYRLEFKDADGNYSVIKEGTFSSESKENVIELDKEYTGYGIRLTALSTHNGQNFAAAVEIDVAKNDIIATEEEIMQVKNTIIEDAKNINLDDYSKVTAKPVADLVAKVKVMNFASKNALDTVIKEYNSLKAKLINVAGLNSVILEGEKLDSNDYTVDSYQVFAKALAYAKIVAANATTNQEVLDALTTLQTAKDALVKVVVDSDKTALKIALDLANAITDKDLESVVPVVVNEFKQARDKANEVYNDTSASQDKVDAAFDRLASIMQKLEFFKGDKTALKAFIDKVSGLEAAKYTEATWTPFNDALTAATSVYEDENAMQEEVNNAYNELVTAFLNLRLIPDKSLLEDLINQANGLNSANYTKATFDGLTKALNEAKVIFDNPNATQKEVDNAKDLLEKAIANLQTVKTPVNNGDTTVSVKTGDTINLWYPFATLALASIALYGNKKRKH